MAIVPVLQIGGLWHELAQHQQSRLLSEELWFPGLGLVHWTPLSFSTKGLLWNIYKSTFRKRSVSIPFLVKMWLNVYEWWQSSLAEGRREFNGCCVLTLSPAPGLLTHVICTFWKRKQQGQMFWDDVTFSNLIAWLHRLCTCQKASTRTLKI